MSKKTGRPRGRPPGTPAFARVERARKALQEQAEFYVKQHKVATQVASKKGNSNPAEWALSHISAIDDRGKEQRIVAPSVDRQIAEAGSGIVVQIGVLAHPQIASGVAPKQLVSGEDRPIDASVISEDDPAS